MNMRGTGLQSHVLRYIDPGKAYQSVSFRARDISVYTYIYICIDIVVSVNPSENEILQWVSAVQVGINQHQEFIGSPTGRQWRKFLCEPRGICTPGY